MLIVGGLRTPQAVVHLVNTSGPLLETSHVHQLLNRLGGDYARLTTIGARPIYFPNDELHVNLLDRLMQEGNVSTFVETKDRSNLKVNLRRK